MNRLGFVWLICLMAYKLHGLLNAKYIHVELVVLFNQWLEGKNGLKTISMVFVQKLT